MKLNSDFTNSFFVYANLHTAKNIVAPPTPRTGLPTEEEDCLEANLMIKAIIKQLDYSIITTAEKEGREIHDIIPIKGKEADYSNEGSKYFPFHVEVPQYNLDERPDFLLLYCVRGNPFANTFVIAMDRLVQELPQEVVELMKQPLFEAQYGVSFGSKETFRTPIIHDNGLYTLDLAEMYGINAEAKEALKVIKDTIRSKFETVAYTVNLKQGDLIIIDNKRCIHARNDYSQYIDFGDNNRWLKRVYLRGAVRPDKPNL